MRNKKLYVSLIAVISLVLITVGITVAFFSYSQDGSTENTVETGSINFIYEEVNKIGNGISIEDAMPVSDADGKAGSYFDFKVTSNTSVQDIAFPYEITARVVDGSDDLSDYVKVYLTKVSGNSEEEKVLSIYSDLSDSTNTLAQQYGDKTLYESEIPAGARNYVENYRLRMWLNNNSSDGSVLDLSPTYACSNTTYTDKTTCESNNGVWNPTSTYVNENKTFSIKINVYATGTKVSSNKVVTANSVGIDTITTANIAALTQSQNNEDDYDFYTEVAAGTTSIALTVNTDNPNATVDIESITAQQASQLRQLSTNKALTLIQGDNYFKVTVTSENRMNTEEYALRIKVLPFCPYPEGYEWDFSYEGSSEKWTVPCDGTYTLEVKGASSSGGGGTATGDVHLMEDEDLYVTVGSMPSGLYGGYNGGGNGASPSNGGGASGGGGATHIAKVSGTLASIGYNSFVTQGNGYIVAGGGGGYGYQENLDNWHPSCCGYSGGGSGGGEYGEGSARFNTSVGNNSVGGDQTGARFGQGSGGGVAGSGGGGGGFSGGGGGYYAGGGGGSGWIGGVQNGTMTTGGNSGNGSAKITLKTID